MLEQYIQELIKNGVAPELAKKIIYQTAKSGFDRGQLWGDTYNGWFTPTKEDTQKKFDELK